MEEIKWTLTDPATNQYGRKISDSIYEFKEDNKDQTEINIDDYTPIEIEECINAFGYSLGEKDKFDCIYGLYHSDEVNWIIAECLYELS